MQARLLAAARFGHVRPSGYGSSGAAAEPPPDVAEGLGCLSRDSFDRIAQAEPELEEWQHEDQNAHDSEQHALHSEPQLRKLVEARLSAGAGYLCSLLVRVDGRIDAAVGSFHHNAVEDAQGRDSEGHKLELVGGRLDVRLGVGE